MATDQRAAISTLPRRPDYTPYYVGKYFRAEYRTRRSNASRPNIHDFIVIRGINSACESIHRWRRNSIPGPEIRVGTFREMSCFDIESGLLHGTINAAY